MTRVWRRLRLGQKVTMAVMASFVPLVLLGVQVANFSGGLLKTQTEQSLGLVAQVEAQRIEGRVAAAQGAIEEVATSASFVNLLALQGEGSQVANSNQKLQENVDLLENTHAANGLLGVLIKINGGTRFKGEQGFVSSESESQVAFVPDGVDRHVGDVFFVENRPRITILREINPTEGLGAVIISEWDLLELIGEHPDLSTFGEGSTLLLLSPMNNGERLVVSSNDLSGLNQSLSRNANPVVGQPVVFESPRNDVVAMARVEAPVWFVSIEAAPAALYADLDKIRFYQIATFVGAGLVIVAVVAVSLRSFVRRLGRMTGLAEAVANGDLTVRTGDESLDELGRLSLAFDDMTEALAQDIARRQRVEAQLAYQATHDSLTGLPNRQQLVGELDRLLVDSDELVSVLFVDLDGFKAVNDQLGHGAGDELLVRVGDRLRGVLRPSDFIARLGGDEFVVVLRGLGLLEAEKMAERIVAALELPFIVSEDECSISASIGVSSANDERSSERLIKEADIAMYRAKALGKGRAVRVTEEALDEVDARVSVLGELREAVSNDELQLQLWPVGDLRTGALIGMESTVRWNHPERGVLAPAEFLPMAVSAGFANQIDEWVVAASIRQFGQWIEDGLPVQDLEMAFNLTTEMFLSPRSRSLITNELGKAELRPVNFRVEVPETVLRSDGTVLRDVFDTYRSMGMPVTLDRFGSDHANLDRLPRFAIDAVKIDLALIADLSNRLSSRALVSSLITLARTAGLRVAAAGVDQELLREQVVELGCVQGQGLWLSQAVTPDEFVELLQSRYYIEAG